MQIEKVNLNIALNSLGYIAIDDKHFPPNYVVYQNGSPVALFFFEVDAVRYVETTTLHNPDLMKQFRIVESV